MEKLNFYVTGIIIMGNKEVSISPSSIIEFSRERI